VCEEVPGFRPGPRRGEHARPNHALRGEADGYAGEAPHGRGLHSSTILLNVSWFCH